MSLPLPTPTTPGLTPNTRTEAEAALTLNALHQTLSAGAAGGLTSSTLTHPSLEPPYPSEETAQPVRGDLSRGTTQAVLAKMEKGGLGEETMLGKRMSRQGERRTSALSVDGGGDGEGKPAFERKKSYKQEDMKRVHSEKLMTEEDGGGGGGEGYSSVG